MIFKEALVNFCQIKPNHRQFLISSIISSLFSLYLALYLLPESLIGLGVSFVTSCFIFIYLSKFVLNPKRWLLGEIILGILMFVLVFHLPSYFLASSRIAYRKKKLKDNSLLKIDTFLFGWLLPKGQLSLYLDDNNFFGPHTPLGMLINNTLQIFYFLYYIIPYITMYVISLANCVKEIIYRYYHKGQKSITYESRWNNTYFLFSVYLFTCVNVFFVNTLVPASSPRKHLKDEYVHPLTLSGFAKFLNGTCKDDRSANSFPSGHVAETICIAFAYLGMGKKWKGLILLFCCINIALATLFLRYHYFADIIMAVCLAGYSYFIAYYFGYRHYLNEVKKYKENYNNSVVKISNTIDDAIINNSSSSGHKNGIIHVKLDEEIGQGNK